jgi:hypothetical protein
MPSYLSMSGLDHASIERTAQTISHKYVEQAPMNKAGAVCVHDQPATSARQKGRGDWRNGPRPWSPNDRDHRTVAITQQPSHEHASEQLKRWISEPIRRGPYNGIGAVLVLKGSSSIMKNNGFGVRRAQCVGEDLCADKDGKDAVAAKEVTSTYKDSSIPAAVSGDDEHSWEMIGL